MDGETDGQTDGLMDGRTDGRKTARLYRTLLKQVRQKLKCKGRETCKNHVISDSGIMISPEPGTKADPNSRLPKPTATIYWIDSDI